MVHSTSNKTGTNILKLAWEYWFLFMLRARKASMTISYKYTDLREVRACAIKRKLPESYGKVSFVYREKGKILQVQAPWMLRQVIRKQNFKERFLSS